MKTAFLTTAVFLLGATAAVAQNANGGDTPAASSQAPRATATMINAHGVDIGTLRLRQGEEGVTIEGELSGLGAGRHGFHIHETGDCGVDDLFRTAGGHFAPDGNAHGLENPEGPHAGDLPNQVANDSGTVIVAETSDRVSLDSGAPHDLFDEDGSAFILHELEDDQTSQPSGESGGRIACGVIEPLGMQNSGG